ncbi:MAG: hypothetical protein F7C35_04885 [Desulfurococcales archaeon]|nr:hypothetical protein [Desulfurococcales archaeon]
MRAIVLDEQTALRILRGGQQWIVKGRPTRLRERVAIVVRDRALGVVILEGSRPAGEGKYRWRIRCPIPFLKPVKVKRKRGQSLWARLDREDAKKVEEALEEAVSRLEVEGCPGDILRYLKPLSR